MTNSGVHTWDGSIPLTCRVEGDYIYVDVDVARLQAAQRRSVDDLERERRLYLRLADLTVERSDGTLDVRRDWVRRAVEFANLYAPPVDYSSFRVFAHEGIPLSHFASEALLVAWALRLHQHMSQRGSLAYALNAVVQIQHVFPVAKGDGVVTLYPSAWGQLLKSLDPTVPVRQASRERWFPSTSHEVRSLTRKAQSARVSELRAQHGGDEAKLWAVAQNVFATAINVRLSGVTLMCLPGSSRSAPPSVGFTFLSPLGRIWYGLWEDLAGLRLRRCERCGSFFIPSRKDQRFHDQRCQNAAKVARWRAGRTPRPPRRTKRRASASSLSSLTV